jgi:hypothetical protein
MWPFLFRLRGYAFSADGTWTDGSRSVLSGALEGIVPRSVCVVPRADTHGASVLVRKQREFNGERFADRIVALAAAARAVGLDIRRCAYGLLSLPPLEEWEQQHPLPSVALSATLEFPGSLPIAVEEVTAGLYADLFDPRARVIAEWMEEGEKHLLALDIASDKAIQGLRLDAAVALDRLLCIEADWQVHGRKR